MNATRRDFLSDVMRTALGTILGGFVLKLLELNGSNDPVMSKRTPKFHNLELSMAGTISGELTLSPTVVKTETPRTNVEVITT